MIEKFKAFIAKHRLFSAQDAVILAVSGGIDSVVMADLFACAGYAFALGHCNFSLRGEASDADEVFVQSLAERYKVPCFVRKFNTVAASQQEGESIQMAARRLRYQWFSDLLEEKNYRYVATAHQKNDVLETILFNLCKGSGIAGFHGIPLRTDQVIRPMLFLERNTIESYARQQGLSWREDSSNFSVKYARNLIRHEVVPHLLKINPGLFHTLDNTLARLQGVERVFQHAVAQVVERGMKKMGEDWFLSLPVLRETADLPVVLDEILKPFGFSYVQSKTVAGQVQEDQSERVGNIYRSHSHVLNIDRDQIIISPANASPTTVYYLDHQTEKLQVGRDFTLACQVFKREAYTLKGSASVAAVDYDKLQFPLQVRKWREGDWFRPLGMKGKKKLSDFMIDRKIPLNLKDRIFVLTSGDAIVWVIGLRMDERFKITGATRQVFQITQY